MHPVTILVILLAAGKMFGLTGLLIAVPVYAVIKVICNSLLCLVQRIFWFIYSIEVATEESAVCSRRTFKSTVQITNTQ